MPISCIPRHENEASDEADELLFVTMICRERGRAHGGARLSLISDKDHAVIHSTSTAWMALNHVLGHVSHRLQVLKCPTNARIKETTAGVGNGQISGTDIPLLIYHGVALLMLTLRQLYPHYASF